ncbi:serine/threonine protein kinase [Bacteroides sp. AF16-49]|uniref:recombinase RecT n=1 Tax=Bacteroides sp. AF16-49 TaxID=2292192 RepID=UPI000F0103A4|nr:recombinase RecT [Bacteroides sp. AF16-49]RHR72419.1 serine/threonine protein kinase [Bacteroides sp. AF16-49]
MSNAIQIRVEELNQIHPLNIVEADKVEQKFIYMYNAIWGCEMGEQIYNREKFYFNKILTEKPELQECTKLSILGCFFDVAVNGLTLDQTSRPQCYLIPNNIKVKTPQGEVWEKRLGLKISAYGEVYMRQRAGQIRYADNPVIVYEGDAFRPIIKNGAKFVEYEGAFPRLSDKPVAAFIRIVRNDGSVDFSWMMETDWKRLSTYSAKQNKGAANALYTSNSGCIDTGFLENKMIKHAFDSYPKVRTGNYTTMETQQEEPVIDYGFVQEGENANEPLPPDEPVPFGEERQIEAPQPVVAPITTADEEEGF